MVPARLDFTDIEAFDAHQLSVDVGVYGQFPIEGVKVSASVGVDVSGSFQKHTVAVTRSSTS